MRTSYVRETVLEVVLEVMLEVVLEVVLGAKTEERKVKLKKKLLLGL